MCSHAICRTCGKASFSGCGQHVDQVLAGVPQNKRCDCASNARSGGGASVLSRLFGR